MILDIDDIHVFYGTSHILDGISMAIGDGEAVAYLGGNGAGKTTTFRAVMGLKDVRSGGISYKGEDITNEPAHGRVPRGIAYVPSDLQMFRLTVNENLELGYRDGSLDFQERREEIFDMFPVLQEKQDVPADHLSGGQQRMLTIGRALINDPDLILLDEPTEGLAPQVQETVVEGLETIRTQGRSMVLIEHDLQVAYELCSRGYVLQNGEIAIDGTMDAIEENADRISGLA